MKIAISYTDPKSCRISLLETLIAYNNGNNFYIQHKKVLTMLKDFNLLATTSRGFERNTCSELRYILEEIGDSAPSVDRSGVSGLIVAKTTLNPFDVIEKFCMILKERPYEFRYALRIIPIEKVVRTDLSEIQQVATELGSRIESNETFRVTVEKRFTETSTKDIIEAAAANIKRKVRLNSSDKILLIEVIGGLTGLSLIKPSQILVVMKEKM